MKCIPKEYIDAFLKDLHKPVPANNETTFNINELINAKDNVFYSEEKNSKGKYIGVAVALEQALAHGSVATMPQLIAGKATADKSNYLWQNWYTAQSEEVIGTSKGIEYYVIVHGGGILTPARIKQAYDEELMNGSAKLTQEEFDNLLEGKINGEQITIYDFNKINEIPDPYGHYAINIPLSTVKNTKSDYLTKEEFITNPLVQARAGSKKYLEEYFDKAQSNNKVGNWHNLENINASVPQARLLFIDDDGVGLFSDDGLNYDGYGGRFLGVARTRNEGAV